VERLTIFIQTEGLINYARESIEYNPFQFNTLAYFQLWKAFRTGGASVQSRHDITLSQTERYSKSSKFGKRYDFAELARSR